MKPPGYVMPPEAAALLEHAARNVAAMRAMDRDSAGAFAGSMVAILEREFTSRCGAEIVGKAVDIGRDFMSDPINQATLERAVAYFHTGNLPRYRRRS